MNENDTMTPTPVWIFIIIYFKFIKSFYIFS